MKDNVKFYTLKEAAERLRVSEKTIRRWIERGLLRRCTALRTILIPVEDVERFGATHSALAF